MESYRKERRTVRYFTLMEMAVVILILGLLATIVTPLYFRHVRKAKISTARTQILMIEQAILDFNMDLGRVPTSLDELTRKTGDDKWDGPYLKSAVPKDPWGNSYSFKVPGSSGEFEIISYGSDGQSGGTGEAADISNIGPPAE
ncbi:MAG TPA: type II secretion system protein GspG [Lentisphaeria bacterium]|nr:MAG: type II secretion system protein GspG [Lentisphaerae bacterium GWF2_49_21]HBC87457.1 type II secretion system protein GspG [Lentisphaeria bacterium]